MGQIQSSVGIIDNVTATLNRIQQSLYSTCSAFEAADQTLNRGFDASQIQSVTQEINRFNEHVQDIQSQLDIVNQRIDEMQNQTEQATESAGGLESTFRKVATVIGTIVSVNALKNFAQDCIESGAEVQASNAQFVQTFTTGGQDLTKAAQDTINNVADSSGILATRLQGSATKIYAFAKSSGADSSTAMKLMSDSLQVAADSAAYYDTSLEDATATLQSFLKGNFANDAALGVSCTEATRNAQAMEMFGKKYQDLTEIQKQQALLGMVQEAQALSGAVGQASRESDGWENVMGNINEAFRQFKAEVGGPILQSLVPQIQALTAEIMGLAEYAPQIGQVFSSIASGLMFVIDLVINIVTCIIDNWSIISPILYGVISLLAMYATYLGIVKAAEIASKIAKIAMCAASYAHAAATRGEASATAQATAAQYGLNTALLACPLTWILVIIVAIIAAIYAVIAVINKITGKTISATGVICGSINVVLQFFKNLGLTIADIALGIWNALGAACSNIGTAFHNIICNVQSWWYGLLSSVLDVIAGIAGALNKLPFVSFDYSGLKEAADDYAAKSAEAAGNRAEYTSISDAFNEGMNTFDTFQEGWVSAAYDQGYQFGQGVDDKVGDMFNNGVDVDSYQAPVAQSPQVTQVPTNIANTADNTKAMKDNLEITSEDLKYIRDFAEMEVVNRFTTAEIKVEMTNHNTVNSEKDLDGISEQLRALVEEEMNVAAEGVH